MRYRDARIFHRPVCQSRGRPRAEPSSSSGVFSPLPWPNREINSEASASEGRHPDAVVRHSRLRSSSRCSVDPHVNIGVLLCRWPAGRADLSLILCTCAVTTFETALQWFHPGPRTLMASYHHEVACFRVGQIRHPDNTPAGKNSWPSV